MTSTDLHLPKGATANARYALDIDPDRAGWTYSSLRVVELAPDGTHTFTTGDSEWIVLPLQGGCTVQIEDSKFQLLGRESVFADVSDFVYAPGTPGSRSPPAREAASPWQERSASDDSPPATAPRRRFPSSSAAAAPAPARCATSPPPKAPTVRASTVTG